MLNNVIGKLLEHNQWVPYPTPQECLLLLLVDTIEMTVTYLMSQQSVWMPSYNVITLIVTKSQ